MNPFAEITSNFSHLFIDEKMYVPKVYPKASCPDGFNEALIRLSARRFDDLQWNQELALASTLIEKGCKIVWEIDLGLEVEKVSLKDKATFNAHTQALEHFGKEVLIPFAAQTRGVILYRGNADFSSHLLKTQEFTEHYHEWLLEKKLRDSPHQERVFCAQAFSEYVHRLISFLPAELIVYLLFNVEGEESFAQLAQLFSKERFEHVFLAINNLPFIIPALAWEKGISTQGYIGENPHFEKAPLPELALVLPLDGACTQETLLQLDALIFTLLERNILFKVVPEFFLTECWDGVRAVIVLSHAVSAQGRRKLLGFVASSGFVFYDKEPLAFLDEEAQALFDGASFEQTLASLERV